MTSRDTPQMTPGYWDYAKLRITSAANEYDLSYRDFFFGLGYKILVLYHISYITVHFQLLEPSNLTQNGD